MRDVHPGRADAARGKYSLVASICAVAAMATTAWAGAAEAGAFLNLAGIPGESINQRHKDEIDVLSYDLSLLVPRATDPNRPSSRLICPPVTVMKNLDLASLPIAKKLVQGTHITRGVLTLQRESTDPFDYFVLTMDEVIVTELSQVTSTDPGRAVEKVVLTARKYELEYRLQSNTGAQTVVKAGWDCTTGQIN